MKFNLTIKEKDLNRKIQDSGLQSKLFIFVYVLLWKKNLDGLFIIKMMLPVFKMNLIETKNSYMSYQ